MNQLISLVVILVLVIPSWLLMGFTGVYFWEWFVLPVFTLAPAITLWQAVGLILVGRYFASVPLIPRLNSIKDDHDFEVLYHNIMHMFYVVIALFVGWIIQAVFL